MRSAGGSDTSTDLKRSLLGGDRGLGSICAAIASCVKGIVGAGVLSLPVGVKLATVLPSTICVAVIGATNALTFGLLGALSLQVGATTTRELWLKTVGAKSAWIIDLAVVINNSLAIVSYMLLLGDFLTSIAKGVLPHVPLFNLRGVDIFAVIVFFILPLSLQETLFALRRASIAGICCILAVMAMLVCDTFEDISHADGHLSASVEETATASGVFYAVALYSNAFVCHYNAVPLVVELASSGRDQVDALLPRWITVVAVSFIIGILVFVFFGLFGFAVFGESVQGNILESYGPQAAGRVNVARLLTAISIAVQVPLVLFTLRQSLLGLVGTSNIDATKLRIVTVVSLLVISGCLGSVLTDLAVVCGVTGAVFGSFLALILPGILLLFSTTTSLTKSGWFLKAFACFMIILGATLGSVCLVVTLDTNRSK